MIEIHKLHEAIVPCVDDIDEEDDIVDDMEISAAERSGESTSIAQISLSTLSCVILFNASVYLL